MGPRTTERDPTSHVALEQFINKCTFCQYTPKGALAYCCQQMQILALYIILQLGSFLKPLGCKPGSLDPNCWLRKELQPLLSWFWPCPPQLSVQQVPEWAKKVGCRTAGNFRCYHLVLECHTPLYWRTAKHVTLVLR